MRRTPPPIPAGLVVVFAVLGLVAASCGRDPSTSPSTASSTTTGSSAVVQEAVGSVLGDAVTLDGAPGGIALLRVDGREWRAAVGDAVEGGASAAPAMTFRIGSITKPLVAVLVLDALDRGLLDLDDHVEDLLPGVLRPGAPVTVRMLLDHTSGIANTDDIDPVVDGPELTDPALVDEFAAFAAAYRRGEPVVASDRLLVGLAETHERSFEPGAGYRYSNTNYQLAAMVLEAATGRPLAALLDERIAEPLGLEHTWLAPADRTSPDLHGHALGRDGVLHDVTDDLTTFGNGGNGGVVANADDLLAMLRALESDRLLPAKLVAEMERPTARSDGTYGLGLTTYRLACGTFFGHGGAVDGTVSLALVDGRGEDGVVIALGRYDDPGPDLVPFAEQLLCDRPSS